VVILFTLLSIRSPFILSKPLPFLSPHYFVGCNDR